MDISITENHNSRAGCQKGQTQEISPRSKRLAPPPESPPGCLASLLLLLDVQALPLRRAVAALGVAAPLLERAVEAVAVGAVRALVTLRPN